MIVIQNHQCCLRIKRGCWIQKGGEVDGAIGHKENPRFISICSILPGIDKEFGSTLSKQWLDSMFLIRFYGTIINYTMNALWS